MWENRKAEGDDALKRLIREGVQFTSAVCVLVGTDTWSRRWVRYEAARAIIDERGLLAVHLNTIKHHQTLTPHPLGFNPLALLAVGKVQENLLAPIRYYLFEKKPVRTITGTTDWQWARYADYADPVKLPPWLADCAPGYVTPLANNAGEYDYVGGNGHKNIGAWIDLAAQRSGR